MSWMTALAQQVPTIGPARLQALAPLPVTICMPHCGAQILPQACPCARSPCMATIADAMQSMLTRAMHCTRNSSSSGSRHSWWAHASMLRPVWELSNATATLRGMGGRCACSRLAFRWGGSPELACRQHAVHDRVHADVREKLHACLRKKLHCMVCVLM